MLAERMQQLPHAMSIRMPQATPFSKLHDFDSMQDSPYKVKKKHDSHLSVFQIYQNLLKLQRIFPLGGPPFMVGSLFSFTQSSPLATENQNHDTTGNLTTANPPAQHNFVEIRKGISTYKSEAGLRNPSYNYRWQVSGRPALLLLTTKDRE